MNTACFLRCVPSSLGRQHSLPMGKNSGRLLRTLSSFRSTPNPMVQNDSNGLKSLRFHVTAVTSQNQCTTTGTITKRGLATGARGSRGHGWYVNYRANKGGRHLQGEYFDRPDDCEHWNNCILEMGSERVYFEITKEPRRGSGNDSKNDATYETYRLEMDLATTVMPETTGNFIELCLSETDGYKGSRLFRFERDVGICGGDVLTNTGKAGKAARGSPMCYDITNDPLAMWHLAGTITMMVPKVGQVDSRFVMCTEKSEHLDGLQRAFGQLTEESVAILRNWQSKVATNRGRPSSFDFVITECGLVDKNVISEATA